MLRREHNRPVPENLGCPDGDGGSGRVTSGIAEKSRRQRQGPSSVGAPCGPHARAVGPFLLLQRRPVRPRTASFVPPARLLFLASE